MIIKLNEFDKMVLYLFTNGHISLVVFYSPSQTLVFEYLVTFSNLYAP
jgi:hypothetical protein